MTRGWPLILVAVYGTGAALFRSPWNWAFWVITVVTAAVILFPRSVPVRVTSAVLALIVTGGRFAFRASGLIEPEILGVVSWAWIVFALLHTALVIVTHWLAVASDELVDSVHREIGRRR